MNSHDSPAALDVGVVLVTLGESTTARARASIERQSVVPSEVITVQGVRPVHRALNEGFAQVRAPLIAQVDSDMVLDPDCLATLREAICASPDLGVAVGHLRDSLVGRVCGIKMFRRAAFEAHEFPDTVSPDTDLIAALARDGWLETNLVRYVAGNRDAWHTVGEHDPAYEIEYTWRKFLLEGSRYCYRSDSGGLRWHLDRLHASRHPIAPLARLALVAGVFAGETSDTLGLDPHAPELAVAQAFVASRSARPVRAATWSLVSGLGPGAIYRHYRALGASLWAAQAHPTFAEVGDALARSGDRLRWLALLALGRGALARAAADGTSGNDAVRRFADGWREEFAAVVPLLPPLAVRLREKAGDIWHRWSEG